MYFASKLIAFNTNIRQQQHGLNEPLALLLTLDPIPVPAHWSYPRFWSAFYWAVDLLNTAGGSLWPLYQMSDENIDLATYYRWPIESTLIWLKCTFLHRYWELYERQEPRFMLDHQSWWKCWIFLLQHGQHLKSVHGGSSWGQGNQKLTPYHTQSVKPKMGFWIRILNVTS